MSREDLAVPCDEAIDYVEEAMHNLDKVVADFNPTDETESVIGWLMQSLEFAHMQLRTQQTFYRQMEA